MDLRQLRALVALADEQHFTRAAARLHIAQPALSQQIRQLEAGAGLPLVQRTTRHVALTQAGLALAARARTVLAEIDVAEAELREHADLLTGTLTMGMTQTPGSLQLPKLLARFHRDHPAITLVVREGLSRTLYDDLRSGRFDVAFLTQLNESAMRGLDHQVLVREDLVLLVAEQHALSKRKKVRVQELRDEAFVSFREGATIRTAFQRSATRAGYEPRIAFEANEASRIRAIVAEGLGVAVLPQSEARSPEELTRALRFDDAALNHQVSLAWRSSARQTPATRAFVKQVRQTFP